MGYNVTLKPSGHRFEVKEGQNILQAGLDAGCMMPYSCRTGVCRTCRGTVREGEAMAGIRPRMIPCRVEKLERPAPDVAVMGLRLPMNENFRFLAGQYIDLLLKAQKRRSYSIAVP